MPYSEGRATCTGLRPSCRHRAQSTWPALPGGEPRPCHQGSPGLRRLQVGSSEELAWTRGSGCFCRRLTPLHNAQVTASQEASLPHSLSVQERGSFQAPHGQTGLQSPVRGPWGLHNLGHCLHAVPICRQWLEGHRGPRCLPPNPHRGCAPSSTGGTAACGDQQVTPRSGLSAPGPQWPHWAAELRQLLVMPRVWSCSGGHGAQGLAEAPGPFFSQTNLRSRGCLELQGLAWAAVVPTAGWHPQCNAAHTNVRDAWATLSFWLSPAMLLGAILTCPECTRASCPLRQALPAHPPSAPTPGSPPLDGRSSALHPRCLRGCLLTCGNPRRPLCEVLIHRSRPVPTGPSAFTFRMLVFARSRCKCLPHRLPSVPSRCSLGTSLSGCGERIYQPFSLRFCFLYYI